MITALAKDGVFTEPEETEVKKLFIELFKDVAEVRRLITHHAASLNEEMLQVGPAALLEAAGVECRRLSEAEEYDEQQKVEKVCEEARKSLYPIGKAMREFISTFYMALECVVVDKKPLMESFLEVNLMPD